MEAWITVGVPSVGRPLKIWSCLRLVIPWLYNNLCWRVSDGFRIKVGLDSIKGPNGSHLLPISIMNELNSQRLDTLDSLWEWSKQHYVAHNWPHAWQINLLEDVLDEWERYHSLLCMACINISQRSDVLVCDRHIGNDRIMIKEAYDNITLTSQSISFSDATSLLWKWEYPLMIKCFS